MATEENKLIQNEKNTCLETESYYYNIIKELKIDNSKVSKYKDLSLECEMSIEEIIEEMENVNKTLQKFTQGNKNTIREHLEYIKNNYKSFMDAKFESIFKLNTMSSEIKKNHKNFSKLLDYSVRKKLIGFVTRSGKLEWDNKKIDDFIGSIAKSNNE